MENERIERIRQEIADLKARWPGHSISPAMWMQLEELEAELEQAEKETQTGEGNKSG